MLENIVARAERRKPQRIIIHQVFLNGKTKEMMTICFIFRENRWVLNKFSLFIVIMFSIFSCTPLKNVQSSNLVQYDTLTNRNVYTFVENMPQYKGGTRAFMNEFGKRFHYEFKEHEDIQSKLRVQFVINRKGALIGARIIDKKNAELSNFEKEGLKTIMAMQNWKPGKQHNENVDVILTMIIDVDSQ